MFFCGVFAGRVRLFTALSWMLWVLRNEFGDAVMNSLVSASVYCKDCEAVLEGTLANLKQFFPYGPIYLIDGGSIDETRRVIRKWQKVEPRFVGLRTTASAGPGEAHNLVLQFKV